MACDLVGEIFYTHGAYSCTFPAGIYSSSDRSSVEALRADAARRMQESLNRIITSVAELCVAKSGLGREMKFGVVERG